jgi:DNA-binding MarR family transcriptional regulator
MKHVENEDNEQALAKPSSAQLARMPKNVASLFVAASVGRLSNLYPHWLLLNIETPHEIPSSRLIVLWQVQSTKALTMGQIAKAVDLTPRGVTRIVDGLESDGLVKRSISKQDKRVKIVEITSKGSRFLSAALPDIQKKMAHLFGVLEKSELIELVRILERLTDHMKLEIDK